jgi:hypothetical protein
VSLTIRIFNIAGRFETCPYDHGNVAQNVRHLLGRGFNPCFVDDARDENPEGVKQNEKNSDRWNGNPNGR